MPQPKNWARRLKFSENVTNMPNYHCVHLWSKCPTFALKAWLSPYPILRLENNELEVIDETRLLGVIIRSDLKWSLNTENLIERDYKNLWIIRRLKSLGAEQIDLVEIYTKMIRSILELAVPAWQGAITQHEKKSTLKECRKVQHASWRGLFFLQGGI